MTGFRPSEPSGKWIAVGPSSNHVLLRARSVIAVVGLCAAVASISWPAAAQAEPAPISALLLRNTDTTIFREPSDTTTLTVAKGMDTGQGTDSPILVFNSQVGTDSSTFTSVSLSAGLTPGTYSTSRIPGDAQAVLDPGAILQCGGDEPGTITVTQADYDGAGDPVDLAASFDVAACQSQPAMHGEIRWHSDAPLEVTQAPALTSAPPATVGSSTEATVQFTSVGNSAATMGAATLSQKPMSDGFLDWSIVNDGCSGQTLQPGESCSVSARIAPIRPDGVPYGTVYATIRMPDGQMIAASAQIAAKVYPLAGQALGLQARGAFRQVVLTWQPPQAVPAGWSVFHQQYYVYKFLTDGSLQFVTATANHTAVLTGQPDLYTARYVVRDVQSGSDAALSVSSTATTASKELIYVDATAGMRGRQLAPQPAASDSTNITNLQNLSGAGTAGLTVARNQSVLAYAADIGPDSPPTKSLICTANVDASPGSAFCSGSDTSTQWDTAPSLSPDGKRVVFAHASEPGAPTTLEIASTATGAKAIAVPNSSGLRDATFNATGTALVAVESAGGSTELVSLGLTGTRTVIPASAGLSDPDVAADGRIVAVRTTPDVDSPDAPPITSLVLLAPGATTPSAITGAQSGTNVRPRFAADGASVYYTHTDAPQAATPGYGDLLQSGDADQIDLAFDAVTNLAGGGTAGTPYILTADGTHRLDTAAPAAQMVAPSSTVDLATTATASWTGTDPQASGQVTSGLRNFDVRYRSAAAGHTFGAYVYPVSWQATTNPSAHVTATPGYEYCFSARARDVAGNLSAWTPERCTISPADDRSVHTTSSRRVSSSYYLHTYSYAAKKSTHFTLSGIAGRRIGILATTCASCGQFEVTLGSRTLGRVNTHASSTHYRQTLWLPATSPTTGTLTATTLSSAAVRLDGIVIAH